jgi:nitrate reductase assembly molybdenum cofactor insertion protein NarJ
MKPPATAWDRLAELVEYPSAASYAATLDACIDTMSPFDAAAPLEQFRERLIAGGLASMRERYVEAFDFDPACTLDVSWHEFGDAPERGALLSALREDLARAAIDERGELPDHLSTLLRLIAREDAARAAALAACITPALGTVHELLKARDNPYGGVIDAIARMLAVVQQEEEQR